MLFSVLYGRMAMRPYIIVGATFQMGRPTSHVEVISAWGYIIHARRDKTDDAVQMIGHHDERI